MLCTSSGNALFEEPSEVLQLLYLTLQPSASPVHTGADVLREHGMARYTTAVRQIDLAAPTWKHASAFFADAQSMTDLGLIKLIQVDSVL